MNPRTTMYVATTYWLSKNNFKSEKSGFGSATWSLEVAFGTAGGLRAFYPNHIPHVLHGLKKLYYFYVKNA